MQEGEENLVLSQERVFGRKRLLHLDDHLSPFVDCLGGGDKLCADGCEFESLMPQPIPAFSCINTWWPREVSALTPAGTIPTLCSWFFVSLGTPIIIVSSSLAPSAF